MKENAEAFLKMADQYEMADLKRDAEDEMKAALCKENVMETILAGHHYNSESVKTAAMTFFAKIKDKDLFAKNREEWKKALKGKDDLLYELLEIVHSYKNGAWGMAMSL